MVDSFIKAAILKMPDGIEFIAFFDLHDRIPNRQAAMDFLHALSLLTSVPRSVSFREDGKWLNLASSPELARFLATLELEGGSRLILSKPVLTIPGQPQTPAKTDR